MVAGMRVMDLSLAEIQSPESAPCGAEAVGIDMLMCARIVPCGSARTMYVLVSRPGTKRRVVFWWLIHAPVRLHACGSTGPCAFGAPHDAAFWAVLKTTSKPPTVGWTEQPVGSAPLLTVEAFTSGTRPSSRAAAWQSAAVVTTGLHVPDLRVEYVDSFLGYRSVHGHSIIPLYIAPGPTFACGGTMPWRVRSGSVPVSIAGSRFAVSIIIGCITT
mmetsp:Transcript_31455/g.82509  ORF Transcript_31455/g.82509 Transcript_31455/m.82509 type:complete len:216 (-) Transcript_31455:629-1276(-)